MQTNTPTEDEPGDAPTDDCACSPLLACYEHYLGDRGRPAIRRRGD